MKQKANIKSLLKDFKTKKRTFRIAEVFEKYKNSKKESYGLQKVVAHIIFNDKTPLVAEQFFSRMLKGQTPPKISIETISRMCDLFGCEPNDLIK